jgi:hypothetical protein
MILHCLILLYLYACIIRISLEYFTDKKYFPRYLVNYWFCFLLLDCHSFFLSNSAAIMSATRFRLLVLNSKTKSFIHGISSALKTQLDLMMFRKQPLLRVFLLVLSLSYLSHLVNEGYIPPCKKYQIGESVISKKREMMMLVSAATKKCPYYRT